MLGTALLIGGLILGVGVIAAFWKEIQAWLKKVLEKIRVVVKGTVEGVRVFFSRLHGVGKEISKNYTKVGMKWKETVVVKNVEIDEIPEEYRKNLAIEGKEYDYTNELERELQQ